MAKYSRMEKFANYRNQILTENDDNTLVSEDLIDFSSRLDAIDTSIASDIKNTTTQNNSASHYRVYNTVSGEKPAPRSVAKPVIKPKEDSFKNEYLDEFIDEVKKYNVDKGYSVSEDTSVNIFNNLKNPSIQTFNSGNELYENTPKVETVAKVEPEVVEETEATPGSDDILDEQQLSDVQSQVLDKRNSITQELQTLLNDDSEGETTEIESLLKDNPVEEKPVVETKEVKVDKSKEIENSKKIKETQKMLENTAKQTVALKEKYDDLDDDMDDMEQRFGSNTRLVNFVLILIILILIVVLGGILYATLLMKGII